MESIASMTDRASYLLTNPKVRMDQSGGAGQGWTEMHRCRAATFQKFGYFHNPVPNPRRFLPVFKENRPSADPHPLLDRHLQVPPDEQDGEGDRPDEGGAERGAGLKLQPGHPALL